MRRRAGSREGGIRQTSHFFAEPGEYGLDRLSQDQRENAETGYESASFNTQLQACSLRRSPLGKLSGHYRRSETPVIRYVFPRNTPAGNSRV